MKLTKSQLKEIIMEELDEGLADITRSVGAGIKGLTRKATTALKKALVDPFKLTKTAEDRLNIMKNMVEDLNPVSGAELSDEEWWKQWNFLKDQYLKSPTAMAVWKNAPDPDAYALDEAEEFATVALSSATGKRVAENKMKLIKTQLKQIIKEELNEVGYYGLGSEPFGAEKYRKKIEGFEEMLDKVHYFDPRMPKLENAIKLSVSEILLNI